MTSGDRTRSMISNTGKFVFLLYWSTDVQTMHLGYNENVRVFHGSRRQNIQVMELLQRFWQAAVQIVSKPPAPNNGGPIYHFWGKPVRRTRCMDGTAPHKGG